MHFTKMHALGNDYVCINTFEEEITFEPMRLAELVSDRHLGIGAEGLIIIKPSEAADFGMEIYDADGRPERMLCDGLRCFAKFVYDHALTNIPTVTVETPLGVKELSLTVKSDRTRLVTVDMGVPVSHLKEESLNLTPEVIRHFRGRPVARTVGVSENRIEYLRIELTVPHIVCFTQNEELLGSDVTLRALARTLAEPENAMLSLACLTGPELLQARFLKQDRELLASGDGAAAVASAAALLGLIDEETSVRYQRGTLSVSLDGNGHVLLCGPATEAFRGEIDT